MYADFKVEIPHEKGKITQKTIKGTTYIYYLLERVYNPDKQYGEPRATSIGKVCEDDTGMMFPNDKYYVYFPDATIPEEDSASSMSSCLHIGTYLVLRKIITDYHLDEMLRDIIGDKSGLFLDLAVYTIITENNAGQYYPDYAYNHPLFTEGMRIYSDSTVSNFINGLERDQSIEFLNRWNENVPDKEHIYISYDSTNKNCQAGDLDLAEFGHAKNDNGKPIVNYSVGYDSGNKVPLFYEAYPGSIVDVSQLQYTLEKAKGFGYKDIGFILDRGYFSRENIHCMDRYGYDFVIMMKGMKSLVRDIVLEVKGSFEEDRENSIRKYKVSGTTVRRKLLETDKEERYFHIYFSEKKRSSEREQFESKIDQLAELLNEKEGMEGYECPSAICRYFEPFYHTENNVRHFVCAREKKDVTNQEIRLCGYFVIITSEKMTAKQALELYKSRDANEKLFRGDKSYLGERTFRTQGTESTVNKIFIEFVALIIRNRFYTQLKEQMVQTGKKENYMTVPAAIRELEKIEMVRRADGNYSMDHAVTRTQKDILAAFGMTERSVRTEAIEINKELQLTTQTRRE